MITKEFIIPNTLGLHVRASNKLVECACKFISDVKMIFNDEQIDCKRILQVMSSGAKMGDKIAIVVTGNDANQAITALSELIESGFGES